MDAFFERRGALCSARNKMGVPLGFGVLMVMALYWKPTRTNGRTMGLNVISE